MNRAAPIIVILAIVAVWSQAGEPFKPGKLPKDVQNALVPGLTLQFLGDKDQVLDARQVRLAAIHVPEGSVPSPFVPKGPWRARLGGYIKAPIRSEYQFQLVALGARAELRINGKKILEAERGTSKLSDLVELARGYNRIEVDFDMPVAADKTLRVLWVGEGFNLEPLPPDSLFTRGDDASLVAHSKVREGRLIFATHQCQRCHALPDGVTKMPEMQQTAPSLEAAGSRFKSEWLAKWIQNPRDLRPQSTMPAVLHGDAAPQQAADIAAYLTSARGEAEEAGDKEQGEKMFRTLGCIACHHFGDPKEADAFDRLPLTFANQKYQPGALVAFLKAPHRHHAWSRMPDFKLNDAEAGHLAAHIRAQAKPADGEAPVGDKDRGKKLFTEVGCAACHVLKTGAALEDVRRLPFPKNDKGCLGDNPEKAPAFGFTKEHREAMTAFLATGAGSLHHETPAEFSRRQIDALKCTSCHRRDGGASRWYQVFEDEGITPETLPLLTWAGEKLQPEWTQKLLKGGIDHRARPWLKARMPSFPIRADLLSEGLTHEHGYGVAEVDRPEPSAALAEVGKKLIPQVGGLNCVQCHGLGATPPTAPFEAPGINLLDAANRLRYGYYTRWMADPPRLDPATKMVKLAPDGKTTGIREVFDGDAHKQFGALWHYIQTLPAKK